MLGAALLAGVTVVRNAAVMQYAETNPQLAARAWPSHPASKLWLGLTEIGLSARQRAPVAQSTFELVWDGARKSPLAPEPFLVRGTARVPRRRGAHHELDGARVLAQRVRLRPLAELRPGLVAGDRHRPPGYRASA